MKNRTTPVLARSGLKKVLAQEVGHAMGFRHVPNGFGYVMAAGEWSGRTEFSIKERQYAQHTYKRGRVAPYCGTIMTCSSNAFGFSHGRISIGTPPVLP